MAQPDRPGDGGPALSRWQAELAAWRIDDDLLAAAPEPPYRLDPALFAAVDDDPDRLPHRLARAALDGGGTVLDVGCGAGAGSLSLAPVTTRLYGVDGSPEMLDAFVAAARARGVDVEGFPGRWPDVADAVPVADVVVCHHVAYNVPDLPAFARALGEHARRRVVLELTRVHPWVPIGPLWRHVHHQPRPTGPTAELARDVLAEAGIEAHLDDAVDRPRPCRPVDAEVPVARRRLCVGPDRDPEIAAFLAEHPLDHDARVAVLWWDTAG